MPLTDVQLANKALGRIGVNKQLTSLADGSPEASAANVYLAEARSLLLASHHWSFATRFALLAESTAMIDQKQTDWAHVYTLPADCLTPVALYPSTRSPTKEQRVPFALVYAYVTAPFGSIGPVTLLATDAPATAAYLHYVTSSALATTSPLFEDALAWALAAELVMPITNKPDVAQRVRQMAELVREQAVAFDLNAREPDGENDSLFIRARY